MGYSLTKILVYGVTVSDKVAKLISENDVDEDLGTIEDGPGEGHIYNAELLADDTDSRIDSLTYTEGARHVVGIVLGSNGYGYNQDLSGKKNFPVDVKHPDAVIRWNKYIVPVLSKYMKKIPEPDIEIVGQTW
jgi:hypothetical protein